MVRWGFGWDEENGVERDMHQSVLTKSPYFLKYANFGMLLEFFCCAFSKWNKNDKENI